MPDSLAVPSPHVLLCPEPCSICTMVNSDPGICALTCTHCWSQDRLNPGKHVFEITARTRLGDPYGAYLDALRMGVQVRGFSLHEALDAASQVPFQRWFTDPGWRDHD